MIPLNFFTRYLLRYHLCSPPPGALPEGSALAGQFEVLLSEGYTSFLKISGKLALVAVFASCPARTEIQILPDGFRNRSRSFYIPINVSNPDEPFFKAVRQDLNFENKKEALP